MPRKLIFLLLLLLWPAEAQPNLVEKVRASLNDLNSYRAEFSTELVPFPDAKPQALTGLIEGKRPDLMRLEVVLEADRVKMTTEMVFDGEWQWVDSTQQSERNLLRKIMKIDADIARPGAPFDTFYYYAGSGFLAGEDYLGTFEQLLTLYDFQEAGQQDGLLMLDGTLIEQKYKEYLSARDQLAISEILSVEDSMAECRLFIDPKLSLPVGYDMGADADKPEVRLRMKLTPDPDLPVSAFRYEPDEGWGVYDATAEIVQARMSAQEIKPGSDLFEAVSVFLVRSDEMSEEMSSALEDEDQEKILALAKADPTQLSKKDIVGQTVLTKAVELRVRELVEELLALGADVNQEGYGLNTPLHLAAANGSQEIAKLLLERGADVEARNSSGETPLHETREQEMIKLLLEAGAPENVYSNRGSLPPVVSERGLFLFRAIQEGETQEIEKYLAYGFTPNQKIDGPWGVPMTPLQGAAMCGLPQLEYLLKRWEAVGAERQEVIDELLGWAASPELVDYLVAQGADVSRVSLLEERLPTIALALLEAGADPSEVDPNGVTPLIFFLTRDQLYPETYQLAEKLIEAGNDINQMFWVEERREDLGKLALVHTEAEVERLQALLALGAEVDLATEKGWTAFHIATTFDRVEAMELLHSKGASLTTQEKDGWTPLHSAAYLNQKDALKFLLKHQKDLNIQDKAGNTALHLAYHLGRDEVVRMLLEHGADPDIKNADGEKAANLLPSSK